MGATGNDRPSRSRPVATTMTEITTDNMALVAFLKMNGCEYDDQRRLRTGGCSWVYFAPGSRLQDLIDEFHRGEAMVEPMEFVRKLGLVRTDMYQFLGVSPKRVRSR